jgi:hypothetical protein
MPRNVFLEKYSIDAGTGDFANPRKSSWLINHLMLENAKRSSQYRNKYGAIPNKGIKFTTKSEILEVLNKKSKSCCYHTCKWNSTEENKIIQRLVC